MTQAARTRAVVGGLLVLVGLYLFAVQFVPALQVLSINATNWPLYIVALGAILLVAALLTWTPPLMIPAAMVGGTGALMFWQNHTNNWASWAYAWALFPIFAGIGIFLMHAMQGNFRQGILAGGAPIAIGLVMLLVFASFFGVLPSLGQYWPLLLIIPGIALLVLEFSRRRSTE